MLPRVHISRSPHSLSSPYPPYADIRFPTLPHAAMDPSGVDFRAFYPYTPNEVKHRKRTTSDQLKILEDVFRRDTKPNAALRTELAARLDMSPRGVQVWFQNRRAKEKSAKEKAKAGKTASTATSSSTLAMGPAESASADGSPSPSDGDAQDASLPAYLREMPTLSRSQEPSPITPEPAALSASVSAPAWGGEHGFLGPMGDISMMRRGSLPVDMAAHPAYDPFARRLSVDASLHRLAYGRHRLSGRNQMARVAGSPYPRPDLPHVATAPISGAFHHARHVSADMHFSPQNPPNSFMSHHHTARASLPDSHLYAFSSRMVPSPIPGPLPSPDFSFGVASLTPPSSADSERSSPDPVRGYAFQGDDSEDDHTSSYEALSRFGSITSVATSDTSNGSVYYSDCPMDHEIPPNVSRRASGTSNQFLGMMSGLDVNALAAADAHDFAGPVDASGSHPEGSVPASAYSSPSTVSPGSTPSLVNEATSGKLRMSHSSELVYALQTNDQPGSHSPYAESAPMGLDGQSTSETPFMYVADAAYTSGSETHLPLDNNFQYDGGELQQQQQQQQHEPSANYYAESYTVEGAYASHNDGGDMTHYDYGSYGNTTSHENAPHSGAGFPMSYS